MNPLDQFTSYMSLGLYKTVEILTSFDHQPSTRVLIQHANALFQLKKYSAATKLLDSIDRAYRTEDEINEILEIRLSCYLNMNNAAAKVATILPHLVNRTLTPKLHILAARAYVLHDSSHSPNHPAIQHLLSVLKLYPLAIELVENLLFIGAPIKEVLSVIPSCYAKVYMTSLLHTSNSEFDKAIKCLSEGFKSFVIKPACVLNKICVNAMMSKQMDLFDSTAELIPEDNLEIVDLRAARLKQLRKGDELNQLALHALNSDESYANSWLAFSYFLEFNGDQQRALQTTRKALLLDKFSRRGFMRHGELRMQRNDTKKALVAFTKAHQIHEGIDSYSAIVQCCCMLEDWPTAEAFGAKAVLAYPQDSDHGDESLTLMGLALRIREPLRATDLFKHALEKRNENNVALNALVDMKIKDEDFDGAEKVLRDYREKNNANDFFFWFKLGEIYGMKRDFQKALEYVYTATRLDPWNEKAKEMLEQLETMLRENETSDLDEQEEDSSIFV